MTLQLVQYLSIVIGVAASVCFVLLVALYRRKEARDRTRAKQTKADIADMTILFQTMRDIIKQQKELARDFNNKLDTKMSVVKQILAQGMERNKELYEKQQVLTRQIEGGAATSGQPSAADGVFAGESIATSAAAGAAAGAAPRRATGGPAPTKPPDRGSFPGRRSSAYAGGSACAPHGQGAGPAGGLCRLGRFRC